MNKIRMINLLRIGAFISLLCIIVYLNLDFNLTKPILINFPLFLSMYYPAMDEKINSSIIFPLLVNGILWIPIKKSYNNIYGIIWFEKWKSFSMVIASMLFCIISLFHDEIYTKSNFWGTSISIFYYIFLRYVLKEIGKEEFLVCYGITSQKNEKGSKKIIIVFLIHAISILFISMEYQLYMKIENEGISAQRVEISGVYVKDISADGKRALLLKSSKDGKSLTKREKWDEVVLYDLGKENEIWKKKASIYDGILKFSKNDKYVFISGVDEKIDGEKLKIYDFEKGTIIKKFSFKERAFPRIKKIEFSKDGVFFYETNNVTYSIWQYDGEKKIASYENPGSVYDLEWLNRNEYIVFRKFRDTRYGFRGYQTEFLWNKIMPDKSIKKEAKDKINSDIENKIERVGIGNVFINGVDEKSICSVISGRGMNGVFEYESYIDIWDVGIEQKIFSLKTRNPILDVVFLQDGIRFIVIEKVNDWRTTVTFWNFIENKKEKIVFLKGIDKDIKREEIKIIKNGEEMVVLSQFLEMWKIN